MILPVEGLPLALQIFVWLIIIFLGLSLGSFTTCVLYRVPRRISLWQQKSGSYRSFCPACQTPLQSRDLIPFFSWLFQKGRCRYCRQPIPWRYPLVELAVLAAVCLLGYVLGVSLTFFLAALAIPLIIGIFSFFFVRL